MGKTNRVLQQAQKSAIFILVFLRYNIVMSILDRLGDVIKSYLNDEDERIFGKSRNNSFRGDPDLNAAYDELDDYLNEGKEWTSSWSDEAHDRKNDKKTDNSRSSSAYADHLKEEFARRQAEREAQRKAERAQASPKIPETLRKDFAELGINFGSSLAECKASYKKLLKKHHPDRHAGHEGNMKKATEKSSRINVSYRRIEAWYETGKID